MSTLDNYVSVKGRFTRSVRVDRDAGSAGRLEGYLPTGRSLEVVRRLVHAMRMPEATRAFSITGPYGSGKSSLALFVDALLGHEDSEAHRAAVELLCEYDPETGAGLNDARRGVGVGQSGVIPAVITAPQREPITTTVLRALNRGANRAKVTKVLREEIADHLARAESQHYATPSYREVRALLEQLTRRKPVLLVLDEFGKNLEAYAESGREGDVYLLQELAEWASGPDSLPLVLLTIQHLAFEAYAADATVAQRREWAKVQGRFEDIPFVDSPAATRSLIATALVHADDVAYTSRRRRASREAASAAERHGLATVADPALVAACFPLHPSTLLVLPELCTRFGQNERTLFSFLASEEPQSLLSFLRVAKLSGRPPWIRLDRVYDYFVESASAFVGASRDSSRWIEVESTIRDAHGLTGAQHRVLKSIGVLNLVAATGSLRASAELVAFACADGREDTEDQGAVFERLKDLQRAGLVVYRDFAQEYRIWRGSDFDLPGALQAARRQIRQGSVARLLEDVQPLRPLVGARHTIQTGTTRAFARVYVDRSSRVPDLDRRDDRTDPVSYQRLHGCDGLLAYVIGRENELPKMPLPECDLPVVTVVPAEPGGLIEAAVELGALLEVACDPNLPAADRAARKELAERTAFARQVLDRAIADSFGAEATWTWHNPINKGGSRPKRSAPKQLGAGRGSDELSRIFDRVFVHSPTVAYETINRTELTSQGAKARRTLLEALLNPRAGLVERLGLDGEGPEVAMYRAVIQRAGMHIPSQGLGAPTNPEWRSVWTALEVWLSKASTAPVGVDQLLRRLATPPYGLKTGTATVVLAIALVTKASQLAVYEHGTFRPRLDAPLAERMVRNPGNFTVKYLAVSQGSKRHEAVAAIANALSEEVGTQPTVVAAAANPTVLTVTRALIDILHRHQDVFTRKTKRFDLLWDSAASLPEVERARAVRDALLQAHEPDTLLFEQLPRVVGFDPLPASGRGAVALRRRDIKHFAARIGAAARVIETAHLHLVEHVVSTIVKAAKCNTLAEVASLAGDVAASEILASNVRRLIDRAKMFDQYGDVPAWLEAVTEAVCGASLSSWDDRTAAEHLNRLHQTVADYARVADLARFSREGSSSRAFHAYMVSATRQDGMGNQGGEVVTVPEQAVEAVTAAADGAARSLAPQFDQDQTAARRALIGVLVEQVMIREHAARDTEDVRPTAVEEARLANE